MHLEYRMTTGRATSRTGPSEEFSYRFLAELVVFLDSKRVKYGTYSRAFEARSTDAGDVQRPGRRKKSARL